MVGSPKSIPQSIRHALAGRPIEDVRDLAADLERARLALKALADMGDGRAEYLAADVMIRYAWVRQIANEVDARGRVK